MPPFSLFFAGLPLCCSIIALRYSSLSQFSESLPRVLFEHHRISSVLVFASRWKSMDAHYCKPHCFVRGFCHGWFDRPQTQTGAYQRARLRFQLPYKSG